MAAAAVQCIVFASVHNAKVPYRNNKQQRHQGRSEIIPAQEQNSQSADDYLGKPFALKEVQARLNALIRRRCGVAKPLIRFRDITFNPETKGVLLNGEKVILSPRETALLELLLLNKNKVLSKETIENKLYSWDEDVASNAVEVHIHHLRKKLGKDIVKTINKIGYTLED